MAGESILIVEDDMIIGQLIKIEVTKLGYKVHEIVSSGRDAITAIAINPVDLVLMDIGLQGPIDGIETGIYLRHIFNIPVMIFLTGNDSKDTIERAKMADPFGYLIKPFKENELFSTIEIGLNLAHSMTNPSSTKILRESIPALLKGKDGIIILNSKGLVLFLNTVTTFMTDWENKAAFLHPVQDILVLDGTDVISRFITSVNNSLLGTPSVRELSDVLIISREGKKKNVSIKIFPLRDVREDVIGVIVQIIAYSPVHPERNEISL